MLVDNDIQKLIKAQKEVFVTKEEFESFIEIAATKKDLENFATKDDIKDIENDISSIAETLGKMDKKLDDISGLNKEVEYIKNILNIPALKK